MISRRYCCDNSIIMKSCHTGPIYYGGHFWNRPREILHCSILIFFFLRVIFVQNIRLFVHRFCPAEFVFSFCNRLDESDEWLFLRTTRTRITIPVVWIVCELFPPYAYPKPHVKFHGHVGVSSGSLLFRFRTFTLSPKHRRYPHTIAIWPVNNRLINCLKSVCDPRMVCGDVIFGRLKIFGSRFSKKKTRVRTLSML